MFRTQSPSPTAYDCRPYQNGSDEACTLVGGGTYYVGVRGYAATSSVNLTIEYDAGSGGGTVEPPPATVTHLNLQGSVAAGELKNYTAHRDRMLARPAVQRVVADEGIKV